MTVGDLIEKLKEYDPQATIIVSDGDGGSEEDFVHVEGRSHDWDRLRPPSIGGVLGPRKRYPTKQWPMVWIGC